jgi:hypothetical protein
MTTIGSLSDNSGEEDESISSTNCEVTFLDNISPIDYLIQQIHQEATEVDTRVLPRLRKLVTLLSIPNTVWIWSDATNDDVQSFFDSTKNYLLLQRSEDINDKEKPAHNLVNTPYTYSLWNALTLESNDSSVFDVLSHVWKEFDKTFDMLVSNHLACFHIGCLHNQPCITIIFLHY